MDPIHPRPPLDNNEIKLSEIISIFFYDTVLTFNNRRDKKSFSTDVFS
jgi:hypothetical protein